MPTVIALLSAIETRVPGAPNAKEPPASAVFTTYLFVVSAANVTTSPAKTVPVPVSTGMVVVPAVMEALFTR